MQLYDENCNIAKEQKIRQEFAATTMYSHTHAIYHGFCFFFCYVVRPPILNKFPLLVSVSYGITNKFAFRLIMQHKKSDRTKANSTRIEHQREHTIE